MKPQKGDRAKDVDSQLCTKPTDKPEHTGQIGDTITGWKETGDVPEIGNNPVTKMKKV